MIAYRRVESLDVDLAIELYRSCSLGERRPLADRDRMAAMLDRASFLCVAYDGEQLVGLARSLSDGVYATYLADLLVRDTHQHRGIGRELIRQTQACAPQASIVLIAAPLAVDYYEKVGFTRHESAWVMAAKMVIESAS